MGRVATPPDSRRTARNIAKFIALSKRTPSRDVGAPAGFSDYAPASMLAAVLIVGLAVANLMRPGEPDRYVVIVPPWWAVGEAMDHVGAVGGAVVDVGRLPNVLFVASNKPDFLKTARQSGGFLAFSSSAMFGCLGASDV